MLIQDTVKLIIKGEKCTYYYTLCIFLFLSYMDTKIALVSLMYKTNHSVSLCQRGCRIFVLLFNKKTKVKDLFCIQLITINQSAIILIILYHK
jgi:hypothetical protein